MEMRDKSEDEMIWNKKRTVSRELAHEIYNVLTAEGIIDFGKYDRAETVDIINEEVKMFSVHKPQKVSSNFLLRLSYLIWLPMCIMFILFLPFKWLFTGTLKFEISGKLEWFIDWHDKIMQHKN